MKSRQLKEQTDKKCLEIFNILIALSKKEMKINDLELTRVFFHDLMVYITSSFLNSSEGDKYDCKFPYIGNKKFNLSKIIQRKRKVTIPLKLKIFNLIPCLLFWRKTVVITNKSLNNNFKVIVKKLIRSYNVKWTKYSFTEVHQDNLDIINETLIHIAQNYLNYNAKESVIFSQNFITHIKSFEDKSRKNVTGDLLISASSHFDPSSKILARDFLKRGKKVLTISHGDSTFKVYNEPLATYGEINFSSDNLSYGEPFSGENDFLHKIVKEPIREHFKSADNILQNLPIEAEIERLQLSKDCKILYVPTVFSSYLRYGPYRDYHDETYANWQRTLSYFFKNISVKIHPKSAGDYKKFVRDHNFKEVISTPLESSTEQFDIVIFDHLSTASNYLFATKKNVIYYDIGLRNIQKDVLFDIKERCHYYQIGQDALDDKELALRELESSLKRFNTREENFTNNYTYKYCLNKRFLIPEVERTIQVIKEIL